VERTAATYRKALWDDTEAYVEIWLEKDALRSNGVWALEHPETDSETVTRTAANIV
jgi:hypothetical protein